MQDFGSSKPVRRTEDPRLLRGAGRFIDDVNLPRQAHGTMLRSPHAHARIRAIDTRAARAAPGVLLVLTGADYVAAGFGPMPLVLHALPGFDIKKVFPAVHWPLATERARYVGDGIAFIVAETRAQAIDAAELIEVDYEPLPAVTDAARAAGSDAPRVWDDCKGNVAFEFSQGDAGAVEEAFSRAAHVIRRRMRVNRLSANPMEPRGVVADYDGAADRFTVYLGTQDVFRTRAQIANELLKLPEEKLRVVAGDIGGSFGMKGILYPETPLAVWASRQLARPVKWVSDRSDSFMSDSHARDKWIDAELALDRDFRFLAIRVHALANVGAYYSTLASFPIILSTSGIAGAYTTPAIHFRATAVFTHTNPTAPYRGSGRPDASFIAERLIDYAARELNIAPEEIRRRNTIPKASIPYQTPLGAKYDSGDFPANLELALERSDFAGFAARRKASAAHGRLRGIGIGANVENAAPPGQEQARIEIDAQGTASVCVGSTDQGQGHATLYTQIACEELGLPPERVRVTEGDTGTLSQGGGTGGSKVSALGALAVLEAARQLVAKGKRIAAHGLEAPERDIEFARGRFTVCGTDRSLDLIEVARAANDQARLPAGMEPGLSATGSHKTSLPTWPSGCHVCELEIDPETGSIAVLRHVAVTDLGRTLNPPQANGQIHGGIAQALGQVLGENIAYDAASGQLLSGSFTDYAMPRADTVCAIECHDNPMPTAVNPLGVKGAGEVGAGCAVPAAMNAVADALSPLGIHHLDMPCTPERVWRAIREAKG